MVTLLRLPKVPALPVAYPPPPTNISDNFNMKPHKHLTDEFKWMSDL